MFAEWVKIAIILKVVLTVVLDKTNWSASIVSLQDLKDFTSDQKKTYGAVVFSATELSPLDLTMM